MTGREDLGDSGCEKARKTGDTARVGAGVLPALHPGAREGRSPLAFLRKEETCWLLQAMPGRKGSRRSVSIAPTRNAAGRGTDCSRETGQQGTRTRDSDSDADVQ